MGKVSREDIVKEFPMLEDITDAEIRNSVVDIWGEVLETSAWDDLLTPRSSERDPDISLVSHTRGVTRNAICIAKNAEEEYGTVIDYNELIASCLLHDVSKLLEFEPSGDGKIGARETEIAQKYQHGFYGAYYAEKHGLSGNIVSNIISHTPFSRMLPVSYEGIILIHADAADSDIHKLKLKESLFAAKLK